MKQNRKAFLHNAISSTLLIFAGLLSVTAIVALIPQRTPEEGIAVNGEISQTNGIPEEETPEVAEVFSEFTAPLKGQISSEYGYRQDPFTGKTAYHKGVDVAVPEGTKVLAAEKGTVTASAYDGIWGNYVVIDHGDGRESYYGHLQVRTVARGDTVDRGQTVGLSGETGKVTGAHLHFQLSYNERTVDPLRYLDLTE